MAFFDDNIYESRRLDYAILQNGWTSLYWQQSVLTKDINWFKREKFEIIEMHCTNWQDTETLHNDLKLSLDFPEYYGKNFDALNDCLSELDINEAGLVIVLRSFHFVNKTLAHKLLDVFANNSRRYILFGKKLLTLVQVDDPNYIIEPVGCCPVLWNGEEWLNAKKGL